MAPLMRGICPITYKDAHVSIGTPLPVQGNVLIHVKLPTLGVTPANAGKKRLFQPFVTLS